MKPRNINRNDFVHKFMQEGGLSYAQAGRAYAVMAALIEEGVTQGARVGIGKVGALVPTRRAPRAVSLNCQKGENGTRRVIELGPRLVYKFAIYRRFIETHPLNWFAEGSS